MVKTPIDVQQMMSNIRDSIEKDVAEPLFDPSKHVDLDTVKSMITDSVSNAFDFYGTKVGRSDVWIPNWALVTYGRYTHQITLGDDNGREHKVRKKFRSRRLARVWCKRSWNWKSLCFCDMVVYPVQPIEYITVNFVVDNQT